MPGETMQQYTAWQLYCLTGSFDRLLVTWGGITPRLHQNYLRIRQFKESVGAHGHQEDYRFMVEKI